MADRFHPAATVARAFGIDPGQFTRDCLAGKYPCRRNGVGLLVDVTAVEVARAKVVSDDDLKRAAVKMGRPRKPPRSEQLLPIDPGWARAAAEWAFQFYRKRLLAHRVYVPPPPFPEAWLGNLKTQQLFTRAQVRELLTENTRSRDADWFHWCNDIVARGRHPNGPPRI